jgi:hypothetical protein
LLEDGLELGLELGLLDGLELGLELGFIIVDAINRNYVHHSYDIPGA